MAPPKGSTSHGKQKGKPTKPVIDQFPRHYFDGISKQKYPVIPEAEYTIDIVLNASDPIASATSLKQGAIRIRELSGTEKILEAEADEEGNNEKQTVKVFQLHNNHTLPFIWVRYTIISKGKTSRVQCILEKSTLYTCVCTFGRVKDEIQKHEKDQDFQELPDIGEKRECFRRFKGLLAKNLSIRYLTKPKVISFSIILEAFEQLASEKRVIPKDLDALGVLFYVNSEPARIEPILDQLVRVILRFGESLKEETLFNFVLNWGDLCIGIEAAYKKDLTRLKALKHKFAEDDSILTSWVNACKVIKVLKITEEI